MTTHPKLLIEEWLPFAALGVESLRERGASSALPPLYFLHTWWARRPLTTSRASIITSVLPQWDATFPDALKERFPDQASYHRWVIHLLGIRGDPVQAKRVLLKARESGKFIPNPYDAPRAFTINPSSDDLKLMGDLLEYTWGTRDVGVMDVTAGGGSIPFEALRYGFTTYANELNPVASVILKATLDYPARFGVSLAQDIRKWGNRWYELVQARLQPFFTPLPDKAEGADYLWARTVACPTTGKAVPLSPNWWLSKEKGGIAAQLVTAPDWDAPRFLIKAGDAINFDPDKGTVSRGRALSPWTNEVIEGDYIKAEAQSGRMGQMLYAVALKRRGDFDFRAPTDQDLQAVAAAQTELHRRLPAWEAKSWVPVEALPQGNKTPEPIRYGMTTWREMFSPRQLLAMLTFLEALHEVRAEMRQSVPPERADAIETYLGIMLDKIVLYNNRSCIFDHARGIRSSFDRHDFAFVWSHSEFDAAANLLPWAVSQVVDAYAEITKLTLPTAYPMWDQIGQRPVDRLHISQGSATHLDHIEDGILHNITFDPPYYDNVMYAELSDFFYVWLKRSVGHLFPAFFNDHLTNKEDEAVANVARFAAMGSKRTKFAEKDYEYKMEAIFRECKRVLREEGVLTIMFTHKRVEAWDTLASALIKAGFSVKASWPVHTESEHSLHQAKKNAAASTILLACRKRDEDGEPVWWDDIRDKVRHTARQKATEFAAQGIRGVDLYISTFGPALSIISEQWPVLTSGVDPLTGEPLTLRPETALDLARAEVVSLRKQGLLLGRDIKFDAVTDWYLMAWDAFGAEEFPYDEARKLAIALGVDLDGDLRGKKNLVTKKSSSVVLQMPKQRRKRGMVDPDVGVFASLIDAVHTALLVLEEDGTFACQAFLKRAGLLEDGAFKQCVQAMLNAIPRTKIKNKWVRPEAELLERLRMNFFPDLTVPIEEEPPRLPTQDDLPGMGVSSDDEGFEDDEAFDEDEDAE